MFLLVKDLKFEKPSRSIEKEVVKYCYQFNKDGSKEAVYDVEYVDSKVADGRLFFESEDENIFSYSFSDEKVLYLQNKGYIDGDGNIILSQSQDACGYAIWKTLFDMGKIVSKDLNLFDVVKLGLDNNIDFGSLPKKKGCNCGDTGDEEISDELLQQYKEEYDAYVAS